MTRMALLTAAVAIGLVGCGAGGGQLAEPVPVKGQVTLGGGQPVKHVLLTLQPLDTGTMAGLKVGGDGTFSGDVVPGKYAYFFGGQHTKAAAERAQFEAALKAVPAKYQNATMEHTLTVSSSGGDLHIQLE